MSFSQVTNPAHTENETTDNNIEENNSNSTTETLTKTDQDLDQESKTVTESLKTDQTSDWQAIWDDNVQAYYYWNTVTNETTWEIPNSISYTEGSYYQPTNDSTISADQAASAATATEEYYRYYYSQYGYYPDGYYYGYDTASTAVTAPSEPPNPLESILDKIDNEVKSKLDGSSSSLPSSSSISQHNEQSQEQEQESSTSDTNTYYQYPQAVDDSDYNAFLAQHGNEGTDYTISARFNTRTGKFQRDPTLTPEKFSSDAKAIRQMSYFFDYESFAEQRSKKSKGEMGSTETKSNKKLNRKDIELFKQKKKERKEMKKKAWLMGGE